VEVSVRPRGNVAAIVSGAFESGFPALYTRTIDADVAKAPGSAGRLIAEGGVGHAERNMRTPCDTFSE
jgi:hypothetical protein